MKARIDYRLDEVQPRLIEWGHPYADEWDRDSLAFCLVVRIAHEDEPVGYVWYHWENHWAKRLEAHICIAPAYRSRWFTRTVFSDLVSLARLCDAHYILARDLADIPRMAKFISRMGFTYIPGPDWWALPIPENH